MIGCESQLHEACSTSDNGALRPNTSFEQTREG